MIGQIISLMEDFLCLLFNVQNGKYWTTATICRFSIKRIYSCEFRIQRARCFEPLVRHTEIDEERNKKKIISE